MAKLLAALGLTLTLIAVVNGAPSSATSSASTPVIEPVIDWGKCPQLAPTDTQRKQKTEIIKACLEKHPLTTPADQLNAEIVEKHRIQLGECALTKEDWFNADKSYKYDKAEEELKKKDVEASMKAKIMDQHKSCKQEALQKFPTTASVIEQVQYYQSCMDFHVSQICNVKIMINPPQ